MKTKRTLIGLVSLIVIVITGGLLLYVRPTHISGDTTETEGAILSREAAISRAALSSEVDELKIKSVKLILRKDFDEQVLGDYADNYPSSGEFAAADSPVWVFVIEGNIGNSLPFFNTIKYDGVILGLDAATGLLAGTASFSASSPPDIKSLNNLSELEDLDGKIEIVPLDLRSIVPPLSEEELKEIEQFEKRKAAGELIPGGE
ncbi:MAG: hypothetical protein KDD92_14255 [Caldilineaceae bacterium]|nr:hypothetical protein [Caldilineaceae bacterium]